KTGTAGFYQGATYGYVYFPAPLVLTKLFDRYSLCRKCPPVCLTCPPFELRPEEELVPEELVTLSPTQQEFVLGLRLSQLAPSVAEEKVSREIQQIGLNMMKKAIEEKQKLK